MSITIPREPRYSNDGVALNRAAVEELIPKFDGLRQQYVGTDYKEDEILNQVMEKLEELRNSCSEAEKKFFSIISQGPKKISNLQELQSELDKLSADSGAFSAASQSLNTTQLNNQIVLYNSSLIKIVRNIAERFTSKDSKFIDVDGIREVMSRILSEMSADTLENSNIRTNRQYFKNSTIEKILKLSGKAKFESTIKNGQENIEITGTLSPQILQEFAAVAKQYLQSQKSQANLEQSTSFKEFFINFLKSEGIIDSIKNGDLKNLFITELNTALNTDIYKITASPKVLKGFLGELWTTVAFKYLFGSENVQATGTQRSISGTKGEIGIDLILHDFNFQIKRYTLINGGWTKEPEEKGMGGAALIERADMPIGNLLLELFATYQFNQPYQDEEYATSIYSRLEELMDDTNLTNIFKKGIAGLLRISQSFNTQTGKFTKFDQYYNTFFMINDKLIPSSLMLQCIIEELQQVNATPFIQNFSVNKIGKVETGTYEEAKKSSFNGIVEQPSLSRDELANLVKVRYSYTINFGKLMQEASNKAASQANKPIT